MNPWLIFRPAVRLAQSIAIVAVAPFALNDGRALKKLATEVYDVDSVVPDRPDQEVIALAVALEMVKAARAKRLATVARTLSRNARARQR